MNKINQDIQKSACVIKIDTKTVINESTVTMFCL